MNRQCSCARRNAREYCEIWRCGPIARLDSLDAKCVGGRAHGDDQLVVRHVKRADLTSVDVFAHDALARHRPGLQVDLGRLRLKVGCPRVRLADWLDDGARLERTERGAGQHRREEKVAPR
eukprot:7212743-Prymnesium_polylepis.2